MKQKKGAMTLTTLTTFFLIALTVAFLMLLIYWIMTGKATSALDYLKDIFKFRLK